MAVEPPGSSGKIWVIALPAVVVEWQVSAERARRRSPAGRSTMVWVLVTTSWIVVIEPC